MAASRFAHTQSALSSMLGSGGGRGARGRRGVVLGADQGVRGATGPRSEGRLATVAAPRPPTSKAQRCAATSQFAWGSQAAPVGPRQKAGAGERLRGTAAASCGARWSWRRATAGLWGPSLRRKHFPAGLPVVWGVGPCNCASGGGGGGCCAQRALPGGARWRQTPPCAAAGGHLPPPPQPAWGCRDLLLPAPTKPKAGACCAVRWGWAAVAEPPARDGSDVPPAP